MDTYLLLLHDSPADWAALGPAEMQGIVESHLAWAQRMRGSGHLAGGEKLTDDGGRHLRRGSRGEVLVSDGPYAEAKDLVGGFYLLQAASAAEAEALAAECPHLVGRQWIELRRVDRMA